MSGRLHTKTATLTLLRDFHSSPERLSEWIARGFRTAPKQFGSDNEPESLSDALKRLRLLLDKNPEKQEDIHHDDQYQQLLIEIHRAGTVSPREFPSFVESRSRPLSQEHIQKHLLSDHESLARLRQAVRNIDTADQNHTAHKSAHEYFSEQTAALVEQNLSDQKPSAEIPEDITLSLLR